MISPEERIVDPVARPAPMEGQMPVLGFKCFICFYLNPRTDPFPDPFPVSRALQRFNHSAGNDVEKIKSKMTHCAGWYLLLPASHLLRRAGGCFLGGLVLNRSFFVDAVRLASFMGRGKRGKMME